MDSAERAMAAPSERDGEPPVPCNACRTALASPSRETVSFLLLDQFTVPVVGCADHLERFRAVCGLTTESSARLLSHVPAGGVPCPGCRLSAHGTPRSLIPVADGATVVLGCPEHQSAIAGRYQTGHRTRERLRDDLDSVEPD